MRNACGRVFEQLLERSRRLSVRFDVLPDQGGQEEYDEGRSKEFEGVVEEFWHCKQTRWKPCFSGNRLIG